MKAYTSSNSSRAMSVARVADGISAQFCFKRYPARLLERWAIPAFLRATPAWTAGAAPDQVAETEQDQDGSDGTQTGDQVVDRGHEVVRRVAQSRREAPAVGRSVCRRRAGLGQRHGDRAEGHVVVDVLDLTLELLDLTG